MSVFKKNGNWWIDCYINGQRVRRKVGPDKRTAQLAEKDLKVRAAKGEWLGIIQIKRITFKKFCKEFMNRQTGKAQNTMYNFRTTIGHLKAFFGDQSLTNIRTKHIEDFISERAKHAKPGTVNLQIQHLKTIFNAAVRWGYLKTSPAEVKKLRLPQKEPGYLTRDQAAQFLAACDGWLHTFVALGLNTGMRRSEVLALEWDDIDYKNRIIKVRSDQEFTTKGKTNRDIPINDFLFHLLKTHPRHITCPRIVYTRAGEAPVRSHLDRHFHRARKRSGLDRFIIHTLRHTFGTTLAAEGVDIVTIQKLMGHTDIKTTQKYLHAAPNRLTWAVENLRLDGTSQAALDREKDRKMHQGSQDMVTGTDGTDR